jgi:hypothetical protein
MVIRTLLDVRPVLFGFFNTQSNNTAGDMNFQGGIPVTNSRGPEFQSPPENQSSWCPSSALPITWHSASKEAMVFAFRNISNSVQTDHATPLSLGWRPYATHTEWFCCHRGSRVYLFPLAQEFMCLLASLPVPLSGVTYKAQGLRK